MQCCAPSSEVRIDFIVDKLNRVKTQYVPFGDQHESKSGPFDIDIDSSLGLGRRGLVAPGLNTFTVFDQYTPRGTIEFLT